MSIFHGDMCLDLFCAAWDTLAALIKDQVGSAVVVASSLAFTVLKVFDDVFQDETQAKAYTRSIISENLQLVVAKCEKVLGVEAADDADVRGLTSLSSVLAAFGQSLFYDADVAMVRCYQHLLSSSQPDFLFSRRASAH
jgi:hypothetical protein